MKFYSLSEQKIEVISQILVRKQLFSGKNSKSACYCLYIQAKRYFISLDSEGILNSPLAWTTVDCCLASKVLYSNEHLGISRDIFPISGTSQLLNGLEECHYRSIFLKTFTVSLKHNCSPSNQHPCKAL